MTARTLYGPDGQPMVSSSIGRREIVKWIKAETGEEIVNANLVEEVAKRVRNQGTSLQQVWDPHRGKPKPTPVTYDTLRMMSHRNEWCRAIIDARKNQIGDTEWKIVPKQKDDTRPEVLELCDEVSKLLRHPSMHGSRPNSRSWRQFIGEVLEDILVLDQGCIEKERDGNGWIVAMYPVDGATIRPNIDEHGGFADDAYVQVVDGTVTANFGVEDLMFIMANPQTDIRFAGYGYSPLEHMIVSVTAELYSSKFNSSYFEKGSIPEGILNLGEDCAPEDVDAFRLYWMNEIMGKPWSIPIVAGKGVEWQQWRDSNRDMQFMEYQLWLAKKICAVYQIAPQDVGLIEDVNRSTADSQDTNSANKGLKPILSMVRDYFQTEVIGPHGLGIGDLVMFEWVGAEEDQATVDAHYALMIENGAANRAEWRKAANLEPGDDPGLELYLVAGQLSPLPGPEDVAVMGAKAQQDQSQQDMQDQMQMGLAGILPPGQPGGAPGAPSPSGPAGMVPKGGASKTPSPVVGKVSEDRNPALTDQQKRMEDVFDVHTDTLMRELADILQVTA